MDPVPKRHALVSRTASSVPRPVCGEPPAEITFGAATAIQNAMLEVVRVLLLIASVTLIYVHAATPAATRETDQPVIRSAETTTLA